MTGAPERFATFPDKNVLIDAAEAIADAWAQCTGLPVIDPAVLTPMLAAGPATAGQALALLGLTELAAAVTAGRIPVGMVQARANGSTLEETLAAAPTPAWLPAMLARSSDVRLRELAPADRETTIVVTTEVMADSQMILAKKGFGTPLAAALVQALVRDVEVVALPVGQRDAIRGRLLDDMAERLVSKAPTHVADVDWDDAFWRVSPDAQRAAVKPDGTSWRQFKDTEFAVYGVDGEDVFLLWQVEYCAAELGIPVRLATSDAHCAKAAQLAGVCEARLYSKQGAGYAAETLGAPTVTAPTPRRAPKVFTPSTAQAPVPTPAGMRRPTARSW